MQFNGILKQVQQLFKFLWNRVIPLGYEDVSGFHLGTPPE
jgi:hypothetical protein